MHTTHRKEKKRKKIAREENYVHKENLMDSDANGYHHGKVCHMLVFVERIHHYHQKLHRKMNKRRRKKKEEDKHEKEPLEIRIRKTTNEIELVNWERQ